MSLEYLIQSAETHVGTKTVWINWKGRHTAEARHKLSEAWLDAQLQYDEATLQIFKQTCANLHRETFSFFLTNEDVY